MVLQLNVKKRDASKSPKSLRREGLLPAVVYGRSQEAIPITVDAKEFDKLFRQAGASTVISLEGLDGAKEALIQEVDTDPVSGESLHADFYAIAKGQTVTVEVPFEFIGESPAVKNLGGILVKVMHDIEIECEPKDLPHSIEVDVSKLEDLESQIKISDLKFPASAKFDIDADEVVAMIDVAKEEEEEAAPADISSIEISEERGKKEEEGEGGEAAPAEEKE